jgi:DNA-binding NarL/FixJ family response regulator
VDDEIDGITVQVAARIGAAAGPDEVLVSGTVRDLVAGSGLAFEERGTLALTGASSTWRLFRLVQDLQGTPASPQYGSDRASVSAVAGRGLRLTPREREVAMLVGRGYSNRRIAEELVIAEKTAEVHARNIREKLGLDSRAQIAAWVAQQSMLPADA